MANLIYRGPTTPTVGHGATSTKGAALTVDEVNINFFGLNDELVLKAPIAGPTFTGSLMVGGGVDLAHIQLNTSGDIHMTRTGGGNSASAIYMSYDNMKYIENSSTQFVLHGQPTECLDGNVVAKGFTAGWGVTSGVNTGAFNARMTTTNGSTWLLSTTSTSNAFLGGIQALESNGTMRLYAGATNYLEVASTGVVTGLNNFAIPGLLLGYAATPTTTSGLVAFNVNAVRQGYVGNATTTATIDAGTIPYVAGTHAFSGAVTVTGPVSLQSGSVVTEQISTLTSVTTTTIATVPMATYRSADFNVQAVDATGLKYHSAKILAIHDDTLADYTEYGTIALANGVCGAFTVAIVATDMVLQVTQASTNSTTYKVRMELTKV